MEGLKELFLSVETLMWEFISGAFSLVYFFALETPLSLFLLLLTFYLAVKSIPSIKVVIGKIADLLFWLLRLCKDFFVGILALLVGGKEAVMESYQRSRAIGETRSEKGASVNGGNDTELGGPTGENANYPVVYNEEPVVDPFDVVSEAFPEN